MTFPGNFTVCIATYGGVDRIRVLLAESDAELRKAKLLIIDDGTPGEDHYPALAHATLHRPNTRLLRNQVNIGVVATYNRLVAECDTPNVLLLDDDAILPTGLLDTAEWLLAMPQVGVLSWKAFGERPGQAKTDVPGFVEPATQLAGYCMAFRRYLWTVLGGFDARAFRHYHGDSDFALRAAIAGHPCYRVWWPLVPHAEHQAFLAAPELKRGEWAERDTAAFLAKWSFNGPGMERRVLAKLRGER